MSINCTWASIDERGRVSGGRAGDQTGREVKNGYWYYFGQNAVIRFKSRAKARKAAKIIREIASQNKTGYNQMERTTLYKKLKRAGWNPKKIKGACNTDCSALIAAVINAVGISVSPDIWTGNMIPACKSTGKFTILYGSKYTKVDTHLMTGDIILNTSRHVIMATQNGILAKVVKQPKRKKNTYTGAVIKLGRHKDGAYIGLNSNGNHVKNLQKFLNWFLDAGLVVDGIYGNATKSAVEMFQRKVRITADGVFGKVSLAKANEYYKETK